MCSQCIENPRKLAIFLDRDGVINVEKSYICSIEELELFDYTKECIDAIHRAGYLAIVVSNQSGIARGLFSEAALIEMNRYIIQEIGVDQIYYCPHHRAGKIKKYALECSCRKPETGMVQRACDDWNIDLEHSYMVGDRADDILLGQNAGMKTVLVNSGYGVARLEKQVEPDYIMEDLREFVEKLL